MDTVTIILYYFKPACAVLLYFKQIQYATTSTSLTIIIHTYGTLWYMASDCFN